jgi:hypothetical protein
MKKIASDNIREVEGDAADEEDACEHADDGKEPAYKSQ